MATAVYGGVTVTASFTDNWVQSSGNVMPTVRQAADGSRPLRSTRVKAYAAGNGATRSCTLVLGGSSTAAFNIGADSSANDTGWRTLVKQMDSGDSLTTRIDANGSFYFGRGGSGSSVDSYGTSWSGRIYFAVEYAQSPTAPAAPSPAAGVGEVALTWAAPSDDGDAAINGYRIQWATDAAFTTGVGSKDVGVVTSDTITGLTPGLTYYFRVAAQNIVTDGAATSGPYSASSSVLLGTAPDAPAAPTLTARAGLIGAAWVAPADGGVPIDAYQLDYSTDPAFGAFTSIALASTARSKTIVGLTPGTTYYVRVLAHNSVGWSAASSSSDATVPARGALDIVQAAALHVSSGIQVEVRSDGADVPTLTLGYVAFGTSDAFTAIDVLPVGAAATDFAAPGGPRNIALVADPTGNLYVIGRRGDSESTMLVRRYARSGTTTWAASGELSQALTSTGNPLVGFAACYVPGTGTSAVPTILVLTRRAGTVGAGSLSYATLNLTSLAASSGSLFLNAGSDPTWLSTPPTSGTPDTGPVDVAPLTSSSTRVALLGNGFAVVDVTNGAVTTVVKAAAGTATVGPWARVIGVNATTFAILTVSAGALAWAFYSTTGSLLGSNTYAGANAQGGAFSAQWDAYYDRIGQVVTVYYVADPAGARTLESIDINTSTFAASAAAALTAALGAVGSTNAELRVPERIIDERRVLVAAANLDTGAKSTAAYVDTSGNLAPNAPALVMLEGYDASNDRTLAWAFSDPNTADTPTAYELEVQRVSDGVNTIDTGKVVGTAVAYLVAAGTLTNGLDYRWRVRTWDALDTAGAWSAYDDFTTAALGTLTIDDPATDNPAGIDTATYPVEWSYVQGDGYVQTQRRVKVVRTSDSAVLSDTTMQASVSNTYTVTLPSDDEVRIEVSIVTNAPGTPTVTATRLITSSFSTPMQPTALLIVGESYITIVVTNPDPTGDKPEVVSNIIERRRAGTAESWVAIAEVEPDGAYNDHAVRSGVAYDYRVRGVA